MSSRRRSQSCAAVGAVACFVALAGGWWVKDLDPAPVVAQDAAPVDTNNTRAASLLMSSGERGSVPAVALQGVYWGDHKDYMLPLDGRPTIVVLVDPAKTLVPMELIRGLRMVERFGDRLRLAVVFVGDRAKDRNVVESALEQRSLLKLGLRGLPDFLSLTDRSGLFHKELGNPSPTHAILVAADGTIIGREILIGPFSEELTRIERTLDQTGAADTGMADADEKMAAISKAVQAVPLLPPDPDAARLPQRLRLVRRLDAAAVVAQMAAVDPDAALAAVRGYCENGSNFSLARRLAEAAAERFGAERCAWARPLLDSRADGYVSVSHWQLGTALSVDNASDLRMYVELQCTLEARWSGSRVAELTQVALLRGVSEARLESDKFETVNAGWGDYTVHSTIKVIMSEGEWPNVHEFPVLTRAWTENVAFLPRNESPEEDDADVADFSPATRALRAGFNQALWAARRAGSAGEQEQGGRSVRGVLAQVEQWVTSAAGQLFRSTGLVGKPFGGLKTSSWVQGKERLGLGEGGTLASPQGRVLLVDFIFVGCPPCRAALPRLSKLDAEYRERGLDVVSVATSWGARGLFRLVEQDKLTHAVGVLCEKEEQRYGVQAFPSYLLIDRRGNVRWSCTGKEPSRELIEQLLEEGN
ncbi:MAG TPA: TlpA disulfide reductase family protein [Phycisphaerae bacterium]|nr:TlpA disulfide reductase family protein [Phycisphaerae bacterium]HRT40596.1 TlpA disulfide reductase family protein [Phycisphaerae bacterium]